MSTKPKFGFIVEYVTDIEASKRFYEEIMSLEVQRYHPTFVQFETFAIASDEPMAGDDKPEIYWLVDDVDAAFQELSPKAEVCLAITKKPFGQVFGIKDPDGRPRYLLEFAKERPSQSV